LNAKWERLTVSLPSALTSAGLWQHGLNKMMIFGGWNTQSLNSIYVLKETLLGFLITKSKMTMDEADTFPINGVWGEDSNGDYLIPGLDCVHRLNDKTCSVKRERKISKE
jgi:hypothetical protein